MSELTTLLETLIANQFFRLWLPGTLVLAALAWRYRGALRARLAGGAGAHAHGTTTLEHSAG